MLSLHLPPDVAPVGAPDLAGLRDAAAQQADERPDAVRSLKCLLYAPRPAGCRLLSELHHGCHRHSPAQRRHVRRKKERQGFVSSGQLLENLREMAMSSTGVVRVCVFRPFDEEQVHFLLAARPGYSRNRIHDHGALQQSFLGKRQERKQCGGGIAAGYGDEVRFADSLRVPFGKPVYCLACQAGVRHGRSVGVQERRRIVQAEVSGKVDHDGLSEQGGAHLRGLQVGKGGEHHVQRSGLSGAHCRGQGLELSAGGAHPILDIRGKPGVGIPYLCSWLGGGDGNDVLHLRVLPKEAQEDHARVSRCAQYRCLQDFLPSNPGMRALTARVSRAAATPLRATTSTVSSPAMVPRTSRMRRLSRAEATLLAWPGRVRISPRFPENSMDRKPRVKSWMYVASDPGLTSPSERM